MYSAKTIVTAMVVFAFVQEVSAREKIHLLLAGSGISYTSLYDRNYSVIPYTGNSWLTTLGLTTETASYIDDLQLFFRYGKLEMDLSSGTLEMKTNLTGGNIHYTHVRTLGGEGVAEKRFFLGGNFSSSFFCYKRSLYGDNYSYCYQSSIGPTLVFRHPLSESGQLKLDSRIDFSLAGYIIHPSFGSNMPENILDRELSGITARDYITGGKIMALNKFQRINCTTSLIYGLSERLAFRLSYNWDFFHLEREDELIQAIHSIYLTIIFH